MALRGRATLSGSAANDDDDDDFYTAGSGAAQEKQRLLVREQDDTVSNLAATVSRVHGMAVHVNEELGSQNRILAEIDEDVERTDGRLKTLQNDAEDLYDQIFAK